MRALAVSLWALLVASSAVNGYLALTADRDPVTTHADARAADCPASVAEGRARLAIGCSHGLGTCSNFVEQCKALVAACEDTVEENLHPGPRFDRGTPDPASRERVAPLVAEALEPFPQLTSELECRSGICRVILEGEEANVPMDFALQKTMARITKAAAFSGEPDPDGGPPEKLTAWFELQEPDRVNAMDLLVKLGHDFEESDALAACHAAHPESGRLVLRVDLHPDDAPIVHVGGGLGLTSAGRCLVERFHALLSALDIPARHTGATRFMVFELPPE